MDCLCKESLILSIVSNACENGTQFKKEYNKHKLTCIFSFGKTFLLDGVLHGYRYASQRIAHAKHFR